MRPSPLMLHPPDGRVYRYASGGCEVVWCSTPKVLLGKPSLRVIHHFSRKINDLILIHYKCYKILEKCPSTTQLRELLYRGPKRKNFWVPLIRLGYFLNLS